MNRTQFTNTISKNEQRVEAFLFFGCGEKFHEISYLYGLDSFLYQDELFDYYMQPSKYFKKDDCVCFHGAYLLLRR